jgi:hypothetical protein
LALDSIYDFSADIVKADCSSQLIRHIWVPSLLLALPIQKDRHCRLRRWGQLQAQVKIQQNVVQKYKV